MSAVRVAVLVGGARCGGARSGELDGAVDGAEGGLTAGPVAGFPRPAVRSITRLREGVYCRREPVPAVFPAGAPSVTAAGGGGGGTREEPLAWWDKGRWQGGCAPRGKGGAQVAERRLV